LVFKNEIGMGKKPPMDSAEHVACDVARTVNMDGLAANYFIAFPAKTAEATLATLKGTLMFELEMDRKLIDLWFDEMRPMRDELQQVQEAMDRAYSIVTLAVKDLDRRCKRSTYFAKSNFANDIRVDAGFDGIDNRSQSDFCDRVATLFKVQAFDLVT
jgi:hypothetical protein